MKSSKQFALAAALLFTLNACGGSGGSDAELIAICKDLCDRLDECETDFSTNTGEVVCGEICEDLENAEDQIPSSCQDAMVTTLECTYALSCDTLDDLDFTRTGRVMHNPPLDPVFTDFTNFPPGFVADPDCNVSTSDPAYDYCPVNPDCVRFILFNPSFIACFASPFDAMTVFVDECETEYLAMSVACRNAPLPF
jgi:hypothetical protein